MSMQQIRTTVYLDEHLYIVAKRKALNERTTLTDLIKRGLKYVIADESRRIADPFLLLRKKYSAPLRGIDVVSHIRKARNSRKWST